VRKAQHKVFNNQARCWVIGFLGLCTACAP
jgi:hypothetical protein